MKFEYHQPQTLKAAVGLLADYGPDAALFAGGTDLLIDIEKGERSPGHLVSLWGIPGLAQIEVNGGARIGALVTVAELAEAVANRQPLQGLVEAAHRFCGCQIQNMATIGGNICNASPAADMVPPLLCLEAELTVMGPNGQRHTPLDGFLIGPDRTALQPGEVLSEINVPSPAPRTGTCFIKAMRRHAHDISIVSVATRISLAEDGKTCNAVRIAVGAAAPAPFRARRAEAVLEGQAATLEAVQEAARRARDESQPIDDVRASADYRRLLVGTLVERAVLRAAERAAQGGSH